MLKTLAILTSASVAALSVGLNASALTLVQTQTFNFGPSGELPTIWSDSATVNKYAPGGLVKVEVALSGTATSTLTATATTSNTAFILNPSKVGANIIASSTVIPSINVDVIPQGTITPTPQTIAGNSTVNLANITGSDSDLQVFTSGLNAFEGNGTFNIDLLAIGSSTLTTGGGNINTSQTTTAGATLIVRYFTEDAPPPPTTPEPATMVGLLAFSSIGLFKRRQS